MIRFIQNLMSGGLIGIGAIILMAAAYAPFNSGIPQKDRTEQFWACLIFGAPITGWGVWMRRGLNAQQPKESDRLRTLFFQLLKESQGQITLLRFAMESGLPGDKAREFLDERAKEFDATFDVDEAGGISYRFNLGMTATPSSPASPPASHPAPVAGATYDVILEEVPAQIKINAIKLVRELTGLGLKEAKDLVEGLPQFLQRGVTWETADATRRQFEAAGLRVRIGEALGRN